MPLVVPGITSGSGSDLQNWQQKLLGKSLGESHNETTFKEADLPSQRRVLKPDQNVVTMDHNPDRLNVHVNNEGIVQKVTFG